MTTTYPGVYIEEITKLSLSVSASETAVPVIFTDAGIPDEVLHPIQSWVDVEALLGDNNDRLRKPQPSATLAADPFARLYATLRSYFDNGGGHCYVAKVDGTKNSQLIAAIGENNHITLLVQAGTKRGKFKDFASALPDLFAIADSADSPGSTPAHPDVPKNALNHAVYHPYLIAPGYFTGDDGKPLPYLLAPSAAVAGIYCRTDRERGVWKAPANVALAGGLYPEANITDQQQGEFNDIHAPAINMIRTFRSGDTRVWGARTLDTTSAWRYVPVRRLFIAAEKDIKAAMRPAVFEPNGPATWEVVRAAIDNYLHSLWQQGALFGNKPEEAYFVRVGKNITMSAEEIKDGKMVVRVGMAAVRPAEFIVLEFSQSMSSAA